MAQPLARDEQGNIWDISDPAHPKFVSHGASPLASPTLPYEAGTAAANEQKAQAEAAMTPDQAAKLHQEVIASQRENMQFVGDPSKHGADYINSIPSTYANYRNIIPMIAHNQVQVGNVARSNNEAKLLIAGAKQFDPNYDPSLAAVRASALQAYTGNGDASQRIQALDRAAAVLRLMKSYSDQMGGPNTGYSPLNSLIAGNQQDMGSARLIAAKKYDSLLPEAMGQIDTLLAGGKTVSGSNEIKQGLDPHASQAERNAAFQALGSAIVNAGTNLKAGWNSAYGGAAAPPVWLSPENASFLEQLTGAKKGSLGADEWHGLPGLSPDGSYSPHMGPGVIPGPGSANAQPPGSENAADYQLSGGAKTRAQIDPVLKALSGHIGTMIANGEPDAQVLDFLKKAGVSPENTNIGQVLQFRNSPDFTTWKDAHPGEPYPIGPAFYTKQVPVSPARRLFNQAAATNIGGDLTAGAVAAGNSFFANQTAKGIGALGGDPAMVQVGMDLLRQNHPVSSLAGDIAGQAGLEGVAGMVPGANLLLASRLGRIGADAAYGAAYQSGNPDSSASGDVIGGLGNAFGGMFGRGLQSAIGKTASGVSNKALQYLDSQGIPLTIGQIGRGSGNIVGRAVGGIEDRLSGLPGFDAVIDAARKRGESGFNQAAFRQAGVPDNLTGGPGLGALNDIKNDAYSFLNPVTLPLDAQFAGSQAGVRAALPNLPAFGNEIGKGLDQIDRVSSDGTISGLDWQSALRNTRGARASIAGQPFADQGVGALKDVEGNLLDLADRQGPPGALDNLNRANALNAQFNTLSKALDTGAAQKSGQMFSPLQLDNASRINTRNFGGRLASLTGTNRPFYDLTQAGMQVMPNLTPDSGTAGRMWLIPLLSSAVGGGIGALDGGDEKGKDAGLGAGYGLALGAAAMGPYSKVGQNLIQRALLNDRTPIEQKIGNYLVNNAALGGRVKGMPVPSLGGMFGGGLYRDYSNYLNSYLGQPVTQ